MIMMIDHPCFRFFFFPHIRKEDVLIPSLKGCLFSVVHVPRNGLASPYGFSPLNVCPVSGWVLVNDENGNIFHLAFLSLISRTVVNFLMYVFSRDYFPDSGKDVGINIPCLYFWWGKLGRSINPLDEEVRLGFTVSDPISLSSLKSKSLYPVSMKNEEVGENFVPSSLTFICLNSWGWKRVGVLSTKEVEGAYFSFGGS